MDRARGTMFLLVLALHMYCISIRVSNYLNLIFSALCTYVSVTAWHPALNFLSLIWSME